MKTLKISVDNLKCGGCANTIKKGIREIEGVNDVSVNPEEQWVEVYHEDTIEEYLILDKLKKMGYPKSGTTEGFEKLGRNLKSYVSCAIGKLEGETDAH